MKDHRAKFGDPSCIENRILFYAYERTEKGIYTTSHTYYKNEGAKGLPQTIKFNKKSRRCTVGVFFAKYSFLLKVKASYNNVSTRLFIG